MWPRLVKLAIGKVLGSLTQIITEDPVVALTFDDGPDPEFTPRFLDVLERHQARGTFFMVGEAAQRYPDLVRRMAEGGHAVGGHSWNHTAFPLLSGVDRRRQMHACEQVLAPYGQRLIRPPYGEQNLATRLDAWWMGYEVVGWNVDVGDWYETDSSLMAAQLVKKIHPGAIVVLHDTLFDKGQPGRGLKLERAALVDRAPLLAALDAALDRLTPRFRFVTVPELLTQGFPYRRLWFKQSR